jgi:hypothetical protein
VNFTSIRPVYIYGPLNYNPVEEYFFHRIKAGRPIVVPGSGMQVRAAGKYAPLKKCAVAVCSSGCERCGLLASAAPRVCQGPSYSGVVAKVNQPCWHRAPVCMWKKYDALAEQ